ncbi:hypothetical protein GZ195_09260, partial [Dermatophilus congolensis]
PNNTTAWSTATPPDLLLIGSIHTARGTFARLLHNKSETTHPTDGFTQLPTNTAQTIYQHAHATRYTLEIAAARTTDKTRTTANAALTTINQLIHDLTHTANITPTHAPPLGYPHSQPTTPAQLSHTATTALHTLTDTLIAALPTAAKTSTTCYNATRRRATALETHATEWGSQARPLPGIA